MKKHWLIIYDIRDTKRLNKVAKVMESYGIRVQYSVFEMDASIRILEEVRKAVKGIINEEEDFLVYFDLCQEDWQKRMKHGKGARLGIKESNFEVL